MEQERYKIILNNIIEKYKNEAIPKIEPFEKERLGYVKKYKILTGIIWGIFTVVFIYTIFWAVSHNTPLSPRRIIGIPLGFLGLWVMACRNIGKDFKYYLKNDIVPIICNCFPNVKYITAQSNTKQKYQKSFVIPYFENIKYDDCFVGKYKNNDFFIEEVEARKGRGNNSSSVFSGVIIQFRLFNSDLKSHIVLHPSVENKNTPIKYLKYIKTGDFGTEEKYDIFTNDENQAKNLITQDLLTIINDLKTAFEAQKVYVSFFGETFYLGLFTYKKLFNCGTLTKPVYTDEQFNIFANKIVSILKIVDYLNYNEVQKTDYRI